VADSNTKVLLTTDDLRRMDDDVHRLDTEIAQRESEIAERKTRREALTAKRKMIHELLAELGKVVPESVEYRASQDVAKQVGKVTIVRRPRRGNIDVGGATWLTEIARILADEKDGVTYDDLRAGIDLGPLADRLRQSDKGLYGGVGKLEAKRELFKHNGRLFSPENYNDFMRRLKAGLVEDVQYPSQQARPSPIGDAILAFINANPAGVESGQIVDELRRNPAFADVVTRNSTAAYNVLKRLLDRSQIRKEGRLYLPKENEPPLGGSETGGAGTPPEMS
jgi:hypothetical protein